MKKKNIIFWTVASLTLVWIHQFVAVTDLYKQLAVIGFGLLVVCDAFRTSLNSERYDWSLRIFGFFTSLALLLMSSGQQSLWAFGIYSTALMCFIVGVGHIARMKKTIHRPFFV